MRHVPLLLMTVFLSASLTAADEAVFPAGRRVRGTLTLDRSGVLAFTPADRRAPLDLAGVTAFRLDGTPGPFRAAPGHLLHLPDGQQVAGIFLGLGEDRLTFRTAWADRLEVPRAAAVALTHLPGWHPVLHEAFTGKLDGWAAKGSPKADKGILVLDRPGQSLSRSLAPTLEAGRIGINMRLRGMPAGAGWVLEARFGHKDGERTVRVRIGARIEADAGGLEGDGTGLTTSANWQRLAVTFSIGSLHITRDDEVVWSSLKQGPGALQQVRLAYLPAGDSDTPGGALEWAAFCVERAVPEYRRPAGEPGQDELWLAGGDQLFGRVVRADGKGVELKGRFGQRAFAWTELRGWFLRRQKLPAGAVGRGPAVRLELRSGLRPAPDLLQGVLTGLDDRAVKLRHPLLGELTIPRSHVPVLRPVVP